MRSTMMQMPLTVNQILERGNQIFGNREIVSRRPDKSLHRTNYAALYRRSRQLAAALLEAGIKPGDRVATLMWNHAFHLEAYFGIPAAGAVLHTLNLRLAPEDIAYIINDAQDRILIVDDVLIPLMEKVKPKVKLERIIVVPTTGAPVPESYDNYERFIDRDAFNYRYPELDENAACGMCYTSGTTGRPKGVVYSHRSTVLHALGVALPDCLNLSVMDAVLAVTPMFHANSWGVPYAAVMVGAAQVYPGQHMGAIDLLDLMENEGVTLAMGVPTIWLTILQALEAEPTRWKLKKGMRMMVGGSAAPPAMITAFEKYDLSIKHGWGMTELSPVGTLSWLKPEHLGLPLEEQHRIRALQGLPLPLVELRVMGEEKALPWDGKSVGELQARGPWVTGGYYNSPTDPDKFTVDGWLRTGDVASISPGGHMRISDRTKDLIKSGGEWISSVDIENAIMSHPAVAEAAVIAVKHPKWDERPLAAVVVKQGKSVTEEELRRHLEVHFAKWQIPDDWAFIDAVPRTSTGKFLKTKLREDFKSWISRTPG
ncbi:long-chain fatty acid--CoA ligase [Cupriavidus nantongensis]|uniref:Long-chain fatty acid--CoA ligase n=1 Tax=Cupriavidus nantongensis TaxID=1796606 RepID=A0A142JV93_9BURK|nr:long-chain fatty acid--CoA ligase [Cupriavidus nantongensis]AMR82005.1 long-chain fatty acid--CoA ligase [Cupriavidus nantongensis]